MSDLILSDSVVKETGESKWKIFFKKEGMSMR